MEMADHCAEESTIFCYTSAEQFLAASLPCPDHCTHIGMAGIEQQFKVLMVDSLNNALHLGGFVQPKTGFELPDHSYIHLGCFFGSQVPCFCKTLEARFIFRRR